MKEKKVISEAVIKRLPRYYRVLKELKDDGALKVSSREISSRLGFTASQVRQDLSSFGEFGQAGCGYDVDYLRTQIESIIGLTKSYNMVLIGVGNIGRALSNYHGFRRDGFNILAAFDKEIEADHESGGVLYQNISKMESYISAHNIDIAILAVTKSAAQDLADRVVQLGVRAIWNFAPIDLKCKEHVEVENMNMSESLYTLCYKLNNF